MAKTIPNMTDAELYNRLGSDCTKEEAFAELYARHSQRVYLYCRRLTGSKEISADLFQDTFLKLLESAQKEREITNMRAYILRIARNQYYKQRRDAKLTFITLEDIDIFGENDQQDKQELTELLAQSLQLLPDEYREALVLQAYNNMSYQEIAEFLEVPVTTIRNWIVRAKKRLREILANHWEIRVIN
jgi:RNA polymerase sigma-70 factor, ECF subfamily